MKEILCLKYNRNPGYGNNTALCVFNVENTRILSDVEKDMIIDAIKEKYPWILKEFSLTTKFIKQKMLDGKWKYVEFRNKEFNCKGRLFLDKIDSFGL